MFQDGKVLSLMMFSNDFPCFFFRFHLFSRPFLLELLWKSHGWSLVARSVRRRGRRNGGEPRSAEGAGGHLGRWDGQLIRLVQGKFNRKPMVFTVFLPLNIDI